MLKAVIFLVQFFVIAAAFAAKCVLPEADTERASASKPSIGGILKDVDLKKKALKIKGSNGVVSVIKINESNMFTNYGGAVDFKDLANGEKVRAWSKDCSLPKKNRLAVEVLIVDKE